jgi:hypothetical protein
MKPIVLARIVLTTGILVGAWILLDGNLPKAMALTAIIVATCVWIRGTA